MPNAKEAALAAVPMMNELNDENLRQLMGGLVMTDDPGRWPTVTCECGCSICTSWWYACTI